MTGSKSDNFMSFIQISEPLSHGSVDIDGALTLPQTLLWVLGFWWESGHTRFVSEDKLFPRRRS